MTSTLSTKVHSISNEEINTSQPSFNSKQIEILKNSICKGASDEEFQVFLIACAKTKLDPFMKQIYAVKRWDSRLKREVMSVQTAIDGYRLIAERTGLYSPGPEPTYTYDPEGKLLSATAYIKKQTSDGTWHTVSSSAYIDEYCQTCTDKNTGEKRPTGMWANMPRTMLAKCAESQALRRAFPAEMSGIYTKEEMAQSEEASTPCISSEQAYNLQMVLEDCSPGFRKSVYERLEKNFKVSNLFQLPIALYNEVNSACLRNLEAYRAKQISDAEQISMDNQ